MPPVINIDADLADADWTKQTWDLQISTEEIWDMPLEDLRHLMALPAWEAAPAELKTAARDRQAIT